VLSNHVAICLKASLLLLQYQRGRYGMLGLFWTDFPRYFAGGGREGHWQHVGALVPVIYDASTRATAIDSMI
jgi:hypothetical protein